jgi:hypothetical protein
VDNDATAFNVKGDFAFIVNHEAPKMFTIGGAVALLTTVTEVVIEFV